MKNRTPLLPLLALSLLAAPAFAAEYEIGTLEELREFMEAVHVEDFAGDTITLTADIDCEGGRFNTGDPEYPSTFRGTFDGGGHVISNFVHAATGSTQEGYGVAMFDFAETGAAILNLTLEGTLPGTARGAYAAPFVLAVESPLGLFMDNCHFRGSVTNYYHAAGLVGFASSGTGAVEVPSVVLTNCSVQADVHSTSRYTAGGLVAKATGVQAFDCSVEGELCGGRTGGLVGEAYGGSFEGCSFSGRLDGGPRDGSDVMPKRSDIGCGGLVACANATFITNCHADVDVSSTSQYTGGLVGAISNGTVIVDCSAAGTVTSTSSYTGGFVGGSDGGTFEIRDCVSSAEVTSTAAYLGGFIGYVTGSGASVISGCRADGYAGGNGSVGGFAGYVNAPMTISNCVARGDVRSSGSYYGGFVGYFYNDAATIEDCWCSGAVWGTGGTIGSFVGYLRGNGTIEDCSIYAFGAGPRPFCGNDATFEGGSLSAPRIKELTHDWPEVKQHVDGATPISTAEELLAVTNDLAGIYVLTADIDFEGAAIEPIGMSTAFSGEFYGQNYAIRNFVVDSTNRYAGLFGQINGGRVSGVVAEGSVRGAYAAAGSSTGTGGFAGLIGSQSLVDGCSFEGAVTNATTYNVGGFVGRTEGSPVILRSCFTGRVVHEANGSADAGGFAGDHGGGYVMDCYAIADVEAGNNRYAAGFAGNANGRITTSWCAASVEGTGNNRGAFAGYAQTGYITKSYYDSGKTSLLAVNNAAYTGITPLTSSEMLHEANFPDFDFDRTWLIDEGATTPYLQTFIVVKRGFDVWTEQSGYPEGTEPGDVIDGIPAGVRYVFNIPLDATSLYALPGEQFFHVTTDAYGNPCVKFRAKRDPYEGVEPTITIYAVLDLSDCISDDPAEWRNLVPMRYDALSDTWHPADGSHPPKMFFKWRVNVVRTED